LTKRGTAGGPIVNTNQRTDPNPCHAIQEQQPVADTSPAKRRYLDIPYADSSPCQKLRVHLPTGDTMTLPIGSAGESTSGSRGHHLSRQVHLPVEDKTGLGIRCRVTIPSPHSLDPTEMGSQGTGRFGLEARDYGIRS
jgi:hypothetical protein